MMISRKHRFIFLAIQKTGSTSIEKALEPYCSNLYRKYLRQYHRYLRSRFDSDYYTKPGYKHMSARMAKEVVGNSTWNRCFTFAFVRNPWDRVLSLCKKHHYFKYESERERAGNVIPIGTAFNDWMQRGANELVRTQRMHDFLSDDQGKVIVNFIGKFENFSGDTAEAFRKLNLVGVKLPHLNASDTMAKGYRDIYSAESRDLVANWMRKDIEAFDYDF